MEWKEVDIEQTSIEIIDGDRGKNYPKNNELTNSGYCLFLSAANVTKNGLQFSNNSFITKEKDALLRKGKLMPQDIVLTTRGTVGNVGFYGDDVPYSNMRINSGMVIIRPGEDFDTMFLYQYLRSCYFRAQITQFQSGSAQPQLPISTLQKMKVIKPDIDAQRRIASILSSLDRKIELNNKINADLEEMAQAIFKNWFVDFEPFKGGKFVDSELGMIPEGWKVVKLGVFFPVKTGKKDANTASVNGKYPFFSCSQNALCTDSYSFDCDAILVAGNGDFNVKWYSGKFDAYQRTYVLIPYNKKLLALLYYVVKRNLLTITSKARGSVIRFITKGNLTDFEFAIPRDLENNEIVDVFKSINEKIFANIKENSRLSLLRDTLLPRSMSGELEVPE